MLTAIILAGGRSSRMGRPKALLPFDGEPLILHIVRQLQPLFDEIVVVAAPAQELPELPARIVHDEVAYQGPVGGISYGLSAASGEFSFVTSCDSGFLSLRLIEHLLSLRSAHDIVVPRWNDRFQPLFAVYGKAVLPHVRTQLASGDLRPVHLFDKVRTRTVEEDEVRLYDPEGASFFNMNTPDDYAEALRRWRASQSTASGESITCTVELFGVARLLAQTREVPLTLSSGATIADVLVALVRTLPTLAERVVTKNGGALLEGYAVNVNGLDFVRGSDAPVRTGDNIAIISADAGG